MKTIPELIEHYEIHIATMIALNKTEKSAVRILENKHEIKVLTDVISHLKKVIPINLN